jgi:hypothetical protein
VPLHTCIHTALVGGFFSSQSHAHDMMPFLKRLLGGAQARRLPAKPGTDGRTSVPEPRGQDQKKKRRPLNCRCNQQPMWSGRKISAASSPCLSLPPPHTHLALPHPACMHAPCMDPLPHLPPNTLLSSTHGCMWPLASRYATRTSKRLPRSVPAIVNRTEERSTAQQKGRTCIHCMVVNKQPGAEGGMY